MSTLPGVDAAPRDASRSQWYTPPELAAQIVEWALRPGALPPPYKLSVLEPSCGHGALVGALRARRVDHVMGFDIDPDNIAYCWERWPDKTCFYAADFLAEDASCYINAPLDLAVMNPPFENGQTEAHILQALKWATRVVCHCPLTTLEGKARKASLWSRVSLTRMVIHSTRPKYGPKGGATAMCTVEVVPELQDGCRTAIEWW